MIASSTLPWDEALRLLVEYSDGWAQISDATGQSNPLFCRIDELAIVDQELCVHGRWLTGKEREFRVAVCQPRFDQREKRLVFYAPDNRQNITLLPANHRFPSYLIPQLPS